MALKQKENTASFHAQYDFFVSFQTVLFIFFNHVLKFLVTWLLSVLEVIIIII